MTGSLPRPASPSPASSPPSTRTGARRQPITWPVTPYYTDGGPTIDVSTGLGYPKKADDAKAPERRPALLRPTGSGLERPAQVLVPAPPRWTTRPRRQPGALLARVQRQAALDQGHAPKPSGRDVQLVLHAIYVRVRPERVFIWPGATSRRSPSFTTRGPEEVRSGHSEEPPEDHGAPQGGPLMGRPARRARGARDGRRRAGSRPTASCWRRALPVRVTAARAIHRGAAGILLEGRACLTVHRHAPDFTCRQLQVRRPRPRRGGLAARAAPPHRRLRAAAGRAAEPPPPRAGWSRTTGEPGSG